MQIEYMKFYCFLRGSVMFYTSKKLTWTIVMRFIVSRYLKKLGYILYQTVVYVYF